MRPLSFQVYRLATALLAPIAPNILRARAKRGKEDAARLGERLGRANQSRPLGPLVWLHGASVGESLSLLPLIDAFLTKRSDLNLLVTSSTVTSATLMAERLPQGVVHQYGPIDTPQAAGRFLEHWRPQLTVFVESEIWPNLLLGAKERGWSLALLSGRLSASSLKGWACLPGVAKAIFGAFDLVMAQDDETAAALSALGARDDGRLNLKRLGAPPPVDTNKLDALRAARGKPVLLAASTHPGEDEIVLDAFRRVRGEAGLVVAPRHPARAIEIEALARSAGFSAGLRSRGDLFGASEVYIADTLGELGLWFSLAHAALIGGSLLPGPGGHNPVEAAQLGCPIITGPHLNNWREVYADLFRADAARIVSDGEALQTAFAHALADPAAAQARAARARQVVALNAGALDRVVEDLLGLI